MVDRLEYDRSAAVAYARQFITTPVSDGYVVLNRNSLASCLPPGNPAVAKQDPFLALSAGTTFRRKTAGGAVSEEAVDKTGAVVLGTGCMDDSAHFVSCCIGSPPRGKGGGFKVPSDPRFPRAPYGAISPDDLVHALEAEPQVTPLLRKSAERKLSPLVRPGDVIIYSKDGRFTGAALFVTADSIAMHSVSRSPDDPALPSKWDFVADLDAAFRWSVYHFPNPVKPFAVSSGPFPGRYVINFPPGPSAALQAMVTPALKAVCDAYRPHHARAADTLAAALVDITDPAAPTYADFFPDETFYVGSMDKVAPLYAAHELRFRLQRVVDQARADGLDSSVPGWERPVLNAVREVWAPQVAQGFAGFDTKMPDRFPKVDTIFTFTSAGQVEFAHGDLPPDAITSVGEDNRPLPAMKFRDWMTLMILWSNNTAAGLVINALGYPYINGALRAAGFWDPPTKNGIWVSANYSNEREAWKPGVDPIGLSIRGTKHYKSTTNLVGTARQFVRLITLAALDKLFDGDAVTCRDMLFVMRKGDLPGNTSFIKDALADAGITVQQVDSKIGINVMSPTLPGLKGIHDCAVVLREKPSGTRLRYVAVVIGGYDRGYDAGAFDEVAVQLDDCIARSH